MIAEAAIIAYFMVLTQILYEIMLFIDLGIPIYSNFVIAVFVFTVTFKICLFKDLKIFIAITSKGAISILALMAFIVGVGIHAFRDTSFKVSKYPQEDFGKVKSFPLLNSNPVPLAGVLAIGYFIHPCVVPVIRKTSIV